MKTIKSYETKRGKRRVIIELDDEDNLLCVKAGEHVKLGYPHGDIVAAHVITEMRRVVWCSASQDWEPAA